MLEGNLTSHSAGGDVQIPVEAADLEGHLMIPDGSLGMIVFAHGTGSSRHSPRALLTASVLNEAGFGTLLFNLLTEQESANRVHAFDIALLAGRVTAATRWLAGQREAAGLPIGYCGASTGAAAVMVAAADPANRVRAIVCRGGRVDLALAVLGTLEAPTLLVVGGNDTDILRLNRRTLNSMRCQARLEVVPGASHLFEEPGALQAVAGLTTEWFRAHLTTEVPGPVTPSEPG